MTKRVMYLGCWWLRDVARRDMMGPCGCCGSCHEDHEEYGYALADFDFSTRLTEYDIEVCCVMRMALEAMDKPTLRRTIALALWRTRQG